MDDIIEDISCPNCKSENCYSELWNQTGEEHFLCLECGYYYLFTWKRDEQGNFILIDDEKKISYDNLILEIEEIQNPLGVFSVTYTNGISEYNPLRNQEDYDCLNKFVAKIKENSDIIEVVLKRYVDGELIMEVLLARENNSKPASIEFDNDDTLSF